MKTVVFAYHNIGIIGLKALQSHGYEIALVVTHIDDPNENRWYGSVAQWCDGQGVECFSVADVNNKRIVDRVKAIGPDIIFSFYCRQLLCADILAVPAAGALNMHGSLLPRYRGCAPVNWVLVNGESETGVTLHYMVDRADAGDIVGRQVVSIEDNDTALTLFSKLEDAARFLLERVLPLLMDGNADRIPQDLSKGSYFRRRTPEDGRIDWRRSSRDICNLVRAVTKPYPGAFGCLEEHKMIIWKASKAFVTDLQVGEIRLEDSAIIGSADGSVSIHDIEFDGQRYEGGQIVEMLRGHSSYMSLPSELQ